MVSPLRFPAERHYAEPWITLRMAMHPAFRLAVWRRSRARRTGQMWLLPEIEYAPCRPDEIPGPVYDRLAQLPLFRA